jgi:RNA recognition motif-containing protein
MQEPNVQPVKKIFMGGLPKVSSEEELFSFLSQHAKIFEISIKRKNNDKKGRCKGHGVVTTDAAGYNSLLSLNQFQYSDRLVTLTHYYSGSDLKHYQETFNKRRLFIQNLPESFEEAELETTFSFYGELGGFYFRKEQEGTKERRIGVVIFHKEDCAKSAYANFKSDFGFPEAVLAFTFKDFKKKNELAMRNQKKKERKNAKSKLSLRPIHPQNPQVHSRHNYLLEYPQNRSAPLLSYPQFAKRAHPSRIYPNWREHWIRPGAWTYVEYWRVRENHWAGNIEYNQYQGGNLHSDWSLEEEKN